MVDPGGPFLSLASDLDPVDLPDGSIVFRGDGLSIQIEGASARALVSALLPLLATPRSVAELAEALPQYDVAALTAQLDRLASAGVLRREATRRLGDPVSSNGPWFAFLERLGIPEEQARRLLATFTVAIIGLEAHGTHLALQLGHCGIGALRLADPYPCRPEHVGWVPALDNPDPGTSRHDATAAALSRIAPSTTVETFGATALAKGDIEAAARGADIVVACMDRAFSAAHYWVNQVSLAQGIPALYSELNGHTATIGPLVLPKETACFMCYRMRRLACEPRFEEAMSHEEHLDALKRPLLHQRSMLPAIPALAGNLLAIEILKYRLNTAAANLAGKIYEFDALQLTSATHPVLEQPDCPVCKKKLQRQHDGLVALTADSRQRGDLRAAARDLVSERTGIVTACGAVVEDPADPERPYFYSARLSNYSLRSGPHASETTSGKGVTPDDAFLSALGEALERYSASIWTEGEVVHCRRSELPADALDPRELVLYSDEQYRDLPYAPYSENAVIGWIRGYSLGREAPVYVPALAVFMNYVAQRREERLCLTTSSGLAIAPSLTEAILASAWEVIERDAYMIAWFNRLSCRAIAFDDHPDPAIADVVGLLRRRGVDVRLFQVPTDRPCHVMLALALAEQVGEPAAIIGLGSHPDPALAARKAVLELGQIRPGLRRRLREAAVRTRLARLLATRRPQNLMDHSLLYASREMLSALDFLLKVKPTAMKWDVSHPPAAAEQLRGLVKSLTDDGTDLIYVNLTPPELERRGLFTTRVIIPGSQPIDFGDGQRRFGGTRLYDLPVRLGFVERRPVIQDLNPDPHPMA